MENLIERLAIIFDEATIDVSELAPSLAHIDESMERQLRPAASLFEMEKREVLEALKRALHATLSPKPHEFYLDCRHCQK